MILLLDLNNLCHRVFHTPSGSLCKKDGTPSGVVLGTMNSIKSLLQKFNNVDKVIACIDGGKSEWRKALYPSYKSQRDYGKTDPEKKKAYDGLWKQIDQLEEILPHLGINVCRVKGQEADDLIAGVCKNAKDEQIIIVSTDKDLLQLISNNVSVYSPIKDVVISPLNFTQFSNGVPLDAYVGYRALIGDSSDNISGIPKIGEKTAANLIKSYGNIDNILNLSGAEKEKMLKSKVKRNMYTPEGLQTLARNNRLMSFKFTEYDKINDSVNEALTTSPSVNVNYVRNLCMKMEYVSLLSNFTPWITVFKMVHSGMNLMI